METQVIQQIITIWSNIDFRSAEKFRQFRAACDFTKKCAKNMNEEDRKQLDSILLKTRLDSFVYASAQLGAVEVAIPTNGIQMREKLIQELQKLI